MTIRLMTIDDHASVYALWQSTPGLGLCPADDSREGIAVFLDRNPTTNFVAVEDGRVVGAILAGHDGRRGHISHTVVDEAYRGRGIGRAMVNAVTDAMRECGIRRITLVVFVDNADGNAFWESCGFVPRNDLIRRDYDIDI